MIPLQLSPVAMRNNVNIELPSVLKLACRPRPAQGNRLVHSEKDFSVDNTFSKNASECSYKSFLFLVRNAFSCKTFLILVVNATFFDRIEYATNSCIALFSSLRGISFQYKNN